MARTGSGALRYVGKPPRRLPRQIIDGKDLGVAMAPADIMRKLRTAFFNSDQEMVEAMHDIGGTPGEVIARSWPELTAEEIAELRVAAGEITRSRVQAWAKRNREMTWLELRALLQALIDPESNGL